MKTITLSLLILLAAVVTGAAMVLPAPNTDTNNAALTSLAYRVVAMDMNNAYLHGHVDRLEREVNRLEVGFMILVVLVVAALSAVCLLTARDRIHQARWQSSTSYEKGDSVRTPDGPAVILGKS